MKKTDKTQIEEAIRSAVRAMLSEMTPSDEMDDAEEDRLLGASRGIKSLGGATGSKYFRDDNEPVDGSDEDEDEGEDEIKAPQRRGGQVDIDADAATLKDIAAKLGVTHQNVSHNILPGATNKMLNRMAFLDDEYKDEDGVNLFRAYIKATPPQQLKKLSTEFGSEAPPDAFVEDYVKFLSTTADGGEDDFTPEELEYMRAHPEEVAKTDGYNEFKQEVSNDKRWLYTKSTAFRDFVRSKLNFQNFVSDLTSSGASAKGRPFMNKDSDSRPTKADIGYDD